MDAEIWSYADTRNGRLILRLLTIAVVLKELAVLTMPLIGQALVDPIWIADSSAGVLAPVRGLLTLLIKFALVLFLFFGFRWARTALGLIYVLTSAYAISFAALSPAAQSGAIPAPMIANGAIGLIIGATFMLSQQLKAYLWGKAASRLIIPIPGDEEGARPYARARNVFESILIAIQRLVSFLLLMAVLGVIAHLYGLTGPLLRNLGY